MTDSASPRQSTSSSATTTQPAATVRAAFNYWGSATSLPELADLHGIFTGSSPQLKSVSCVVEDIRSHGLSSFDLSHHGFQVLRSASSLLPPQSPSIPDFHDQTLMSSAYWPEVVALVKSQLGVQSAVAINTTVRDVETETAAKKMPTGNPRANPTQSFYPFFVVHGDYTPAGARAHMRALSSDFFEANHMAGTTSRQERDTFFRLRDEILAAEDEAMKEAGTHDQWAWSGDNYAGPRWAILSVWRPLETVRRDPLAVMDPSTLFRKGVVDGPPYAPFKRMYRDRPGFQKEYQSENMLPIAPKTDDGNLHQWYYISEQRPDEVYALKLFDSEAQRKHEDGKLVAECAAHSAFHLPGQESKPVRRSVEVRVMVIW